MIMGGDKWLYLVPLLAACLAYVNSIDGDFVHDDLSVILSNGDVTADVTNYRSIFNNDFWGTSMADVNSHKSYRPITILSFRCLVILLLVLLE